jgi:hypothetical protein
MDRPYFLRADFWVGLHERAEMIAPHAGELRERFQGLALIATYYGTALTAGVNGLELLEPPLGDAFRVLLISDLNAHVNDCGAVLAMPGQLPPEILECLHGVDELIRKLRDDLSQMFG